jgi:hypothetical protein
MREARCLRKMPFPAEREGSFSTHCADFLEE